MHVHPKTSFMQAPLILKIPHLACKIWNKKYLLCIEKSSSSHVALSESCINTNNRHSTCRCQNHPFKLKAWVIPCSPKINRAALLSASCHSDPKDPQESPTFPVPITACWLRDQQLSGAASGTAPACNTGVLISATRLWPQQRPWKVILLIDICLD